MAIGFGGTYAIIKGTRTKKEFISTYNSKHGVVELDITIGFVVTIVSFMGLNLIAQ